MTVPLSVQRTATVLGSTATGAALGLAFLRVAGQAIVRHLPAAVKPTGPDDGGFGAMIDMFMNIGYNIGLTTGVLMTLAVLGGLTLGLALARRVGRPNAPAAARA